MVVRLTERINGPTWMVFRATFDWPAPAKALGTTVRLQVVVQFHSEVWEGGLVSKRNVLVS